MFVCAVCVRIRRLRKSPLRNSRWLFHVGKDPLGQKYIYIYIYIC